jgi:hypothetical protein
MALNPQYFTSLIAKVNAFGDNIHSDEDAICTAIQNFEAEIMADIQAMLTSIENQIKSLLPMVSIPTDLGSCISWITNAAAPYIKAVAAAEAEIAEVTSSLSALAAAIQNAASKLTSCTVTPTIVVPPTLLAARTKTVTPANVV